MPGPTANPRPWTIFYAALLLIALALVVIYPSRGAFYSPLALVVVAAIGLAALLLQIRFRQDIDKSVQAPTWLNVIGLAFAVATVITDFAHLNYAVMFGAALGAVLCFGISGIVVLDAMRKART